MRTGAVQQALTPEASSVLKLSLSLAKRRGHAQITPLHVAITLLNSSRGTTSLLRRACLKSHPFHPSSHPLHCRALELCFNVALNRLPSIPPPSTNSLMPMQQPSLSNSLIAALKRAQAQQRRSSIELQHYQQQQQQQLLLQEQPLLSVKVELEQLIISILDDPSVSRVMREAGFSSSCVKANVEEACSASGYEEFLAYSHFLKTRYCGAPIEMNPFGYCSQEEDLKVLFEVLVRKQSRRRWNTVVVGDSVSKTECLVAELVQRVRRGEVPDELKMIQFIQFNISPSQLKSMTSDEVEIMVYDLRGKVASLVRDLIVVIYVGDLRWVVDEEEPRGSDVNGYNPLEHFVQEVGRLLSDMKSCNKVWLMATANYKTYMKCQRRQPSLERQWELQVVVVPSGGLALSLQSSSEMESRVAKITQSPFNQMEERERLICCAECTESYEKEASIFKLSSLIEMKNKDLLHEMRRKWIQWCRTHHQVHQVQYNHQYHTFFDQKKVDNEEDTHASFNTLWPSFLPGNQTSIFMRPHSISVTESSEKDRNEEAAMTLEFVSPLFANKITSEDQTQELLTSRLQEHIPWQSDIIPRIARALLDSKSTKNRGATCILIHGNDSIGKRRLAKTVSEFFFKSLENLAHVDMKNSQEDAISCAEKLLETLRKDPKRVVLIEGVDHACVEFIQTLAKKLKLEPFNEEETIFIFTTGTAVEHAIAWKKRKHGSESTENNSKKKPRVEAEFDLNIGVNDHEDDHGAHLPCELLEMVVGSCFTLDIRMT